jgi:hypothetical protein
MSQPNHHPSFYFLDGLRLGVDHQGDQRAVAAQAHVRTCAVCAAYVRGSSVAGQDPGAQAAPSAAEVPVPAWLGQATLAPPGARVAPVSISRRRLALLWPSFSALAVAAVLVFAWQRGWHLSPAQPGQEPAAGVREKGGPAVRVFVKRGAKVFAWDGRDPVQVDDRLRFEIHGASAGFISVASRPVDGRAPVVLYAGSLGAGVQLLPLSFRVDADGPAEVVSVITAGHPIAPDQHTQADEAFGGTDPWRQILIFTKGTPP